MGYIKALRKPRRPLILERIIVLAKRCNGFGEQCLPVGLQRHVNFQSRGGSEGNRDRSVLLQGQHSLLDDSDGAHGYGINHPTPNQYEFAEPPQTNDQLPQGGIRLMEPRMLYF